MGQCKADGDEGKNIPTPKTTPSPVITNRFGKWHFHVWTTL